MRQSRVMLAGCVCALMVLIATWWLLRAKVDEPAGPPVEQLLADARQALESNRLATARQLVEAAMEQSPPSSAALLLAGEIALWQQRLLPALALLEQVSEQSPDYRDARYLQGEAERLSYRLAAAEQHFEAVLKLDPEHILALRQLAFLKRCTGRPRQAAVHLRELLKLGATQPQDLVWLADPDQVLNVGEYLEQCRQADPEDWLPLSGMGVLAQSRGELQSARQLLESAVEKSRDSEILAAWGICLLDLGETAAIYAWVEGLSESERASSDLAFPLGMFLEEQESPESALASYARTLLAYPDHRAALHRCSTLLTRKTEQPQVELLEEIQNQLQLLARLKGIVSSIDPQQPNQEVIAEASGLLTQLQRPVEAQAWEKLSEQPITPPAVHPPSHDVQLMAAFSRWAAREISWPREAGKRPAASGFSHEFAIDFRDISAEVGLDFRYFESPDPATEGRRMFEFTGGGVGVLDYDLDGWPDLYFTQGTTWPPSASETRYRDALYRQVAGRYERVDAVAGLTAFDFGQGVAIGDLNNDGFPDIYVASFGENRLYLNNGDGTFSESEPFPESIPQWTTSCVIADLDGDGNPDLFDVNYVTGPGVDETICQTPAGPRVCTPIAFSPSQDRFLRSEGDGTFTDATTTAGFTHKGNGLGVVVANLDDEQDLELFVANDLMENFLWKRKHSTENHQSRLFENQALLRGVAYDHQGDAQACMGIAIADLTGNGLQDLFITNYFNEANTLYLFGATGLAEDRIAAYGLKGPTLPMLGFGTQALDANSNGLWDLVVANGDLDDFAHEARPFAMRPQLFVNTGSGRFDELSTSAAGSYFAGAYRGRGLAKLDWNRDGLTDFVVSHLDLPSALVENRSERVGSFLTLKLVGTASSRDAIGTSVRVQNGERVWWQQLTAGDGYQASNERVLHFGGLDPSVPVQLTITWPSGQQAEIPHIACDRTWILIEGGNHFEAAPAHRFGL